MTIMMAWIANLEEQIMIAGVSNRSCPVCLVAHENFNSWNGPISHAPCLPKATISKLCLVRQCIPKCHCMSLSKKYRSDKVGFLEQWRKSAGKGYLLAQMFSSHRICCMDVINLCGIMWPNGSTTRLVKRN